MPSQLQALKSELARVGLSRQSQPATGKRKRSQSRGPQDQDRDKRTAQLERIHDKFNQFDTKVTKLKHEVAGRKLKGVTGRPTSSKQAAIDLVHHHLRPFEISADHTVLSAKTLFLLNMRRRTMPVVF